MAIQANREEAERNRRREQFTSALAEFLVTLIIWMLGSMLVFGLSAHALILSCIIGAVLALVQVSLSGGDTTTALGKIAHIAGAVIGIILAFKLYPFLHL